jgi:tetratricopeptide (TPR) repeat protein
MSRSIGISFLIIGSLLVTCAARAEDSPTGCAVFLTVREPDPTSLPSYPAGLLPRELMRQAFLIAARDEFGLSTRDVILRENFPEKPDEKCRPFELFCGVTPAKKDLDVEYLLRPAGSNDKPLWRWTINLVLDDPKSITTLAEKAEAFARGEFKDVLTRAGRKATVPAARASADVPEAVHDLLWSWNEISVLAGLRRVHAEIRDKGESPELLAALAIGYANLGSLTEYHYSAAFKAYYARGLLYAERLVHATNALPWALWHRAYARMQVGLHKFAADDIAAAKKKQGASSPAKPLPFWTEVLDAFGEGDLSRMTKAAKTPPEVRLAKYLAVQAVVFGELEDMTIEAVQAFLQECPDFARGYDMLATSGQLGPGHEGSYLGLGRTGVFLRKRLPDVPGLPAPTARQIAAVPFGADFAAETEFRNAIVASLEQAGAPQLDRDEPSLSALGHMIEEIDFAQVLRRLEFDKHMYGLPTDETVQELRPLCAGHRYAAYLAAFQQKLEVKEQSALELTKKVDVTALTFKHRPMLQWLRNITRSPRAQDWTRVPTQHRDPVFSDLLRDIRAGISGNPDDPRNAGYMWMLARTSDKLPAAVAQRVNRDWAHIEREAGALERTYADDPLVMKAFADRYYRLKRYDDAERCAKRLAAVHPGYGESHLLANIYKAKNDMVHWRETLEKALALPPHGLEQASTENSIALDLMKRKEWKQAVVYADSAAESYAAWSMLTAARCHEMLGDWKKSEQLVRAVSERYDNRFTAWLKWCVLTGHGDLPAATEFTRSKYDAMGTSLARAQYRNIGHFYLLTDEPEKALLLYQRAYDKGHDPFEGFHAALVADSLGKTAVRDRLLQQIIEGQPRVARPSAVQFKQLAEQLRQMLPPKGAKSLDLAAVDKILAPRDPAPGAASASGLNPSALPYFVGIFLKNRGDLKTAQAYLIRCAQSDDWEQINHVLACKLLREMKVKVPEVEAPKKAEPAKPPAAKKSKAA